MIPECIKSLKLTNTTIHQFITKTFLEKLKKTRIIINREQLDASNIDASYWYLIMVKFRPAKNNDINNIGINNKENKKAQLEKQRFDSSNPTCKSK